MLLGCQVLVVHEALCGKSTWWKRGPLEVRATPQRAHLSEPVAPHAGAPGQMLPGSPLCCGVEAGEGEEQQQEQGLLYGEPSCYFYAETGEVLPSCHFCAETGEGRL